MSALGKGIGPLTLSMRNWFLIHDDVSADASVACLILFHRSESVASSPHVSKGLPNVRRENEMLE